MRTLSLIVVVLLGVACSKTQPPTAPQGKLVPIAEGLPVDHPPLNVPESPLEGFVGRKPRRVSINQLKASLDAVTGGIIWRDTINYQPDTDVLEYLAATLGRPDYAQATHENLDPNVLFAKFVSDGARKVCLDVAARDLTRVAADRVLMRHVGPNDTSQNNLTAVVKNTTYLKMRFLGDDSDAYAQVGPFVRVFDDTLAAGGTTQDGWLGVCVAMLSDPLFVSY